MYLNRVPLGIMKEAHTTSQVNICTINWNYPLLTTEDREGAICNDGGLEICIMHVPMYKSHDPMPIAIKGSEMQAWRYACPSPYKSHDSNAKRN